MEPLEKGDGFRLSTGRTFYANRCILGIAPDHGGFCSEGYDGGVAASYEREEGMDDEELAELFTPAERVEIADYMIALWQEFKEP